MNQSVNIRKIIGSNIKRLREKKKMTQEQLAELINIGIPALSKIECGKSLPKVQTLEKIVEVLDFEPFFLLVKEQDFDVEKAYLEITEKLKSLKKNKELFKHAYDFVYELSKNVDD